MMSLHVQVNLYKVKLAKCVQSQFSSLGGMYGGYGSSNYGSKSLAYVREKDQPLDTVSCLIWDPYKPDPAFFATSWDGFVRYYMVKQSNGGNIEVEKAWEMFLQQPVLCCDLNDSNILFAGLATGDIAAIRLQNNEVARLGAHDAPICGIFWLKDKNVVLSVGFDNLIKIWSLDGSPNSPFEITLPVKTHTASYDYPYLLIGSAEGTIAIINLKNLPSIKVPKHPDDYLKTSIERFSKFNCSRILGGDAKVIALGTVDGRCLTSKFKESYDNISILEPLVSRSQKTSTTRTSLYGQIDCVDLGYASYEHFSIVGGTEDLSSYNLIKKSKSLTYITSSSTTGATTAARLSPKLDLIAVATGTDWTKGIHELQTLKKPKIGVAKLSQSDIKDLTGK